MDWLPEGTTWLDGVTLLVAGFGAVIGSIGLFLTIRRDRAQGRINLALTVEVESRDVVVRISNTERRTVSAERAGLTTKKQSGPLESFAWTEVRMRVSGGRVYGEPALPHTLQPGDPAYPVRAPLYAVRGAFFPEEPEWAWCEDTYGTVYWERIPAEVRAIIRRTKRQEAVEDGSGGFTMVEVDDDEPASLESSE